MGISFYLLFVCTLSVYLCVYVHVCLYVVYVWLQVLVCYSTDEVKSQLSVYIASGDPMPFCDFYKHRPTCGKHPHIHTLIYTKEIT